MVGTLDTLMTLSDELGKTDQIMESIVRKIEKTTMEVSDNTHNHSNRRSDLTVGGVPSHRYIQQFAWDAAKYPSRRPLKELVNLIATASTGIDEELKQLQNSYADKVAFLQELKRKKVGNLITIDLNDVLTNEIMDKIQVIDTDYLTTLFIAIPKAAKENFETGIYKIGSEIVGFGGPDWTSAPTKLGEPVDFGPNIDRSTVRGSPVVPDSLQFVTSDDDSSLYAVTILKGQYEAGYYEHGTFKTGTYHDFVDAFKSACRDKRFIVRDNYVYNPNAANASSMELESVILEVEGMQSALCRWCKNHYGDAFVAWMHLKVIRVFVESVLRYGLPVDFTAVLYKCGNNKESELIASLDKQLGSGAGAGEEELEDDAEEYHEFVLLKFEP